MLATRPIPNCRGFTLLELLVAVAILAVIAGLTLAAVQSARESARRNTCVNNLREIGTAMYSFSGTSGTFPGGNQGRGYSMHVAILPCLDMATLYNSINMAPPASQVHAGSPNYTVAHVKLAVFLCPSDATSLAADGPPAGVNYPVNRGVLAQGSRDDGAFILGQGLSQRDFLDGTSNTVAASESVLGPGFISVKDPKGSVFSVAGGLPGSDYSAWLPRACHNLITANAAVGMNSKGLNWLHGDYIYTMYNHLLTPNDHSCMSDGEVQAGFFLHRVGIVEE